MSLEVRQKKKNPRTFSQVPYNTAHRAPVLGPGKHQQSKATTNAILFACDSTTYVRDFPCIENVRLKYFRNHVLKTSLLKKINNLI